MSARCGKSATWVTRLAWLVLRSRKNFARDWISISIAWKAWPSNRSLGIRSASMSKRHWLLAILVFAFAEWCVRGQDNANDARIQQYVQLLQPAMWSELYFVRQVCDLTPEQRPGI